jgi:hypothetical protein
MTATISPQKELITEGEQTIPLYSDDSTDEYEFYDSSVTINDSNQPDLNNKSVYLL